MWLFNLLHTYQPQPILFRIGPIAIHWYGLLIAIGIGVAWIITRALAQKIKSGTGIPIFFHVEKVAVYGIIFGLLGGRLYHVLSELPYYIERPLQIFMIWRGGLGIFGALVGGGLALWLYGRKHNLSFLLFVDLFAPGIILAQAIGRWGNYFNSELFGLPTSQLWGIPIAFSHRPAAFMSYEYFHPAFLYESLWNVLVFIILLLIFYRIFGRGTSKYRGAVFAAYLILYSFGRFFIEFIRIDLQPMLYGLRLAQVVAIIVFVIGWIIFFKAQKAQRTM